ncbi:hypothetical protein COCON_G00171750, partial [Conger conger]
MCFLVFFLILLKTVDLQHRSDLPDVGHILVYVFGSAVLSVLNAVALATEVFLKAEKGQRTVEDLQVILLPLESFFLVCWIGLHEYAKCMQDTELRKQLSLIFLSCKKPDKSKTPEAVEMDPLSPPEQSTVHRQEVFICDSVCP